MAERGVVLGMVWGQNCVAERSEERVNSRVLWAGRKSAGVRRSGARGDLAGEGVW